MGAIANRLAREGSGRARRGLRCEQARSSSATPGGPRRRPEGASGSAAGGRVVGIVAGLFSHPGAASWAVTPDGDCGITFVQRVSRSHQLRPL